MIRRPPRSTLFPTRRSSDLFADVPLFPITRQDEVAFIAKTAELGGRCLRHNASIIDRKSTRLNSSHLVISYAVFCLKKNLLFSSRRIDSRRTSLQSGSGSAW